MKMSEAVECDEFGKSVLDVKCVRQSCQTRTHTQKSGQRWDYI